MLAEIKGEQDRIVGNEVFKAIKSGLLSLEQFGIGFIDFYPLVASFPKFLALTLAKVPITDCTLNNEMRDWLINNIDVERLHARWWKDWAIGFGVQKEAFATEISPPVDIDALNNYLWRICTSGSLAECLGAVNFAIEGPTGLWSRSIKDSLAQYKGKGAHVSPRTLRWVTAHASYDDKHPQEALRFIELFAVTAEEQKKVQRAVKRSLEYYILALDRFVSSQS